MVLLITFKQVGWWQIRFCGIENKGSSTSRWLFCQTLLAINTFRVAAIIYLQVLITSHYQSERRGGGGGGGGGEWIFLGLFSVQEISRWHHGNFPFLCNPDLGSEPKLSRCSVLVCPWGSYTTFLSFYFLIHKRRVVGFRANISKALRTSVLHHPP